METILHSRTLKQLCGIKEFENLSYKDATSIVLDLVELRIINNALAKIAEDDCNGNPKIVVEYYNNMKYEYEIQDKARALENSIEWNRLIDKVKAICKKRGWSYRIQRDPRESIIKLDLLGDDSVKHIGKHTDLIC